MSSGRAQRLQMRDHVVDLVLLQDENGHARALMAGDDALGQGFRQILGRPLLRDHVERHRLDDGTGPTADGVALGAEPLGQRPALDRIALAGRRHR